MSNRLGIIRDINAELNNTVARLESVNREIITISQSARQATSGFANISLPSDLETNTNASQQAIQNLTEALEQQRQETLRLAQQVRNLQRARANNNRRGIQARIAEQALRKELRIQAKAVTDLGSAYDNLSAQTNALIRERQNLAIRQRTNSDLTEQEILRLNELTGTIQRNQSILSETDQEIGNFRRNVGNYASAYDGLGNSINQLTRELPAFANSMQTGFMAISNNLPMFFDEIQRINKQNKILISEGKKTQSVLKQVGRAFLTLQSILSFGVVILTAYGAEIISLIVELFKTEKQLNAATVAQEALNKAQIEGSKAAASQVAEAKILFDVAKDVTRSTKEREKAVDELIESSNGLISATEKQNILNGDALEIEERLINALFRKYTLQALINQTEEKFEKVAISTLKIKELTEKIDERSEKVRKFGLASQQEINKLLAEGNQAAANKLTVDSELSELESQRLDQQNELKKAQEEINEILKLATELSDEFTLSLTDRNKNSIKAIKGSIAFLEQQIAVLEEQRVKLATNSKEWADYTKLIDDANVSVSKLKFQLQGIDLKPVGDQIRSSTQVIREALDNIFESTDAENAFEEITDAQKEELDQQVQDFEEAEKRKRKILKDALKLQKSLRQEFTFSSIDAINDIFDAQIQSYDNQIEANANFFDRILENEELSDDQRASLEQQRDEREEELREKQKKEEQKAFLFNQALALAEIGLNLAKTITAINLAAAAQDAITPFAFGGTGAAFRAANIPFAIGVAAAQTASVLAQTLPAFEHGKNFRDNYEGLGIWGEKKRELKISKDGKMEMSPKKIGNHLTYVKKDDIIIPDADKYINSLSDNDLRTNLQRHVYNANISNQNYIAERAIKNQLLSSKALENKLDTLTQVLENKKLMLNLTQDMSSAGKELGKQLRFQERKRNTL